MLKAIKAFFSRNEHTSPELASTAAKVVRMNDAAIVGLAVRDPKVFRSMAASLLTQVRDNVVELRRS